LHINHVLENLVMYIRFPWQLASTKTGLRHGYQRKRGYGKEK
jgi:hypothetical protein